MRGFEQRRGGHHAELLRRGRVVSPPGVAIEAWPAEIRATARVNKIRVATIRDGDVAICEREYSDAEVRAELECGECVRGLGAQTR